MFYTSSMIADVAVRQVIQDPKNKEIYTVQVDIVKHYKGKKHTTFKIFNGNDYYQDFLGNEYRVFNSCSTSMEIGKTYRVLSTYEGSEVWVQSCRYTNHLNEVPAYKAYENIKHDTLNLKMQNEFGIEIPANNLKKSDFAFVEFELDNNLTVKSKKLLKKFSANHLNTALLKALDKEINFKSRETNHSTSRSTRVYYMYEYYLPTDSRIKSIFLMPSKV